MYGSDWPSYLPEGTWKEALAAFTQSIGPQTMIRANTCWAAPRAASTASETPRETPPKGSRTAACALALFALNAYITLRLFHTDYTRQMGSIEAAYIGLARYIANHSRAALPGSRSGTAAFRTPIPIRRCCTGLRTAWSRPPAYRPDWRTTSSPPPSTRSVR